MLNPNCDGNCWDDSCSKNQEVRLFPTPSGGNLILCQTHYEQEIKRRTEMNVDLSPEDRYYLTAWEELRIYDTNKKATNKGGLEEDRS